MSRSEFKVQGGQEGVGIQPKKAIAGQGRLLRLLQRMPASPLSKWVETIIRRGKLVQLALIILGIGFLLFEAIVANPLPLILVVVVLSFVAGWKKGWVVKFLTDSSPFKPNLLQTYGSITAIGRL